MSHWKLGGFLTAFAILSVHCGSEYQTFFECQLLCHYHLKNGLYYPSLNSHLTKMMLEISKNGHLVRFSNGYNIWNPAGQVRPVFSWIRVLYVQYWDPATILNVLLVSTSQTQNIKHLMFFSRAFLFLWSSWVPATLFHIDFMLEMLDMFSPSLAFFCQTEPASQGCHSRFQWRHQSVKSYYVV